MSKPELHWLQLRWPRSLNADQVAAAMRLIVTSAGVPTIIESVGTAAGITHRIGVSESRAEHLSEQLRAVLPGLATVALEGREPLDLHRLVEVRLSTAYRPLTNDEDGHTSRSVLTALGSLHADETLALQWVLGRERRPQPVSSELQSVAGESWAKDALLLPLGRHRPADADLRRALRSKYSEPGRRVAGRIGVSARSHGRERQLIRQVLDALRSAEAPGVGFWLLSRSPALLDGQIKTRRFPLRLSSLELAAVAAWPVDGTDLPVERQTSRLLPPSRQLASRGRVIGTATYPGKEGPLALSTRSASRHSMVLGPTGTGKSTLLANLVQQDIAAGRSVVVIDPKSDLVADILEFIPEERADDVVVIAPADAHRSVVGINPLATHGEPPELVADGLLAIFKGLTPSWGPRLETVLHAASLTLASTPGSTLVALPQLLTDARVRRQIVGGLDDPITLGPFWAAFDSEWSDGERVQAVEPALNRVRPFLRPQLRAVLGQSEPRFDIRQVFTKRKIVLVDLAKGQIGTEASALLASLIVSALWRATLGRSAIPPEKRHPVSVVLDEFADYVRLPLDLSDALAQARGLGVSITLATQFLGQLDAPMRMAAVANAQNKIVFRPAADDARTLAALSSQLDPEDFLGLGAYEFYCQLVAGDAVQPWCSGKSLPLPEPISDPDVIRERSRGNYGRDRREVEAAIRSLVETGKTDRGGGNDLTPRRRGGAS